MTTCPGRAPSAVAGCLRGSWVWRERGADVLGSRGLGGPGGSGPAHVQQGPPAGASPRAGSMPLTCPLPHPLCPQASARPVCGASSRKPVPGPPASCILPPLPTQDEPEKVKYGPQTNHIRCPILANLPSAFSCQQPPIRTYLKPSLFPHHSFPTLLLAIYSLPNTSDCG